MTADQGFLLGLLTAFSLVLACVLLIAWLEKRQ